MASAPQRRSAPPASRASARELFNIAREVKAEFRAERILALVIVSISLVIGLSSAVFAVVRNDWSAVNPILYGSGGVCTAGIAAIFHMYNRSLVFMERMAGAQNKGEADAE